MGVEMGCAIEPGACLLNEAAEGLGSNRRCTDSLA